jgi:hypothetical protein
VGGEYLVVDCSIMKTHSACQHLNDGAGAEESQTPQRRQHALAEALRAGSGGARERRQRSERK